MKPRNWGGEFENVAILVVIAVNEDGYRREKARAVIEELKEMKLKEAAKKEEDNIEETLTYCEYPNEHLFIFQFLL